MSLLRTHGVKNTYIVLDKVLTLHTKSVWMKEATLTKINKPWIFTESSNNAQQLSYLQYYVYNSTLSHESISLRRAYLLTRCHPCYLHNRVR